MLILYFLHISLRSPGVLKRPRLRNVTLAGLQASTSNKEQWGDFESAVDFVSRFFHKVSAGGLILLSVQHAHV